ncbi:hypothetical protein AUJ94_00235 [bacterium CG2_30_40_12]|uniref:Uncharacterized protein n=1 Tax=candidate division WWE3 bacterium CG23_combo_of_CG06-09_8_20_14_all_40_14 TaxID=1975095 RepID=A0A2G9XCP7_UNCKA|nr:MAG: hypothetical protein AUJ94_00235 [bacterium CG2_30_40_12]OJI09339.1 MAG: hypothetical protein BK003_00825 [bacterium CG09_39_24]PIP04739.1 MAG: hypothetical protein COX53_00845 [candidate division WWE3 bacterium CG23_combo_of_CG06-09_8_20_14_all_40_14]PJE51898.1 MAG: hypothetical protein COV27_01085 [candidate division WWE3 bacterium CG10_big_fil_rev_8_21_14_0_10_39_14]
MGYRAVRKEAITQILNSGDKRAVRWVFKNLKKVWKQSFNNTAEGAHPICKAERYYKKYKSGYSRFGSIPFWLEFFYW